jgi:biopolymer transport protein ExbD
MAATTRRGRLIADINVTPLVDIMLVLLIIFMLTANLISKQSIEIELPKASSGSTVEPTTLGITLTRAGKLFLNGEEVVAGGLRRAVVEAIRKDEKAQAIIAADRLTSHGRVVWVIDLVKQAGIASFAINIDPAALISPQDEDNSEG